MKGASVKQLQATALRILDTIRALLTREPARLIGYGSAGVIYLAARFLADKGYLDVPMTFDQSLTAALAAMTTLVIIVESIRRFVYSPQTYIEDLADESAAAHEAAHLEEEFKAWLEAIKAEQAQKASKKVAVVGTAKPAGSKTDAAN